MAVLLKHGFMQHKQSTKVHIDWSSDWASVDDSELEEIEVKEDDDDSADDPNSAHCSSDDKVPPQTPEESMGPELSEASDDNHDDLDDNSSGTEFVTYSKPTTPSPRNVRRGNTSSRQASSSPPVPAASPNPSLVASALNQDPSTAAASPHTALAASAASQNPPPAAPAGATTLPYTATTKQYNLRRTVSEVGCFRPRIGLSTHTLAIAHCSIVPVRRYGKYARMLVRKDEGVTGGERTTYTFARLVTFSFVVEGEARHTTHVRRWRDFLFVRSGKGQNANKKHGGSSQKLSFGLVNRNTLTFL
jgi:hypothetical protein